MRPCPWSSLPNGIASASPCPDGLPGGKAISGFASGSTVNTRYGHQEEVEVGYNPDKPGRGSHHPLLCEVAGTRLALHMEWRQGNTVSATGWLEAMEKIWSHPDVRSGLKLNRGDIGFAEEKIMA